MKWVYLSADKGSMSALHQDAAEEHFTHDWEHLYTNWNCLFVNLKWLSENWESHFENGFERQDAIYQSSMREET
ncbi:hypothetical protein J6TS1_45570 [Siminovitchia terrae]|uniref:Uncharacterized protein n=1 Tax=Siminovitchia terrae TaxID=1914933 RepID=A0A429X4D3_SIMTE|nr:hypothetical protein [Siminovitchia terrae]RST58143.1 hypothetical protein D5F11_018745 [Siminovitchia terrae]GIN93435.1 hypothetical protein J22TS1_44860 [Siminovitchia terrae]GIN98687.1 hypothetical protein J6TS1_45570 [Siminovitchia terrae]